MVKLAFVVLPYLENERVQALFHPPDCAILFWQIGPSIEIVRADKYLLRFFKANATLRVFPLAWIEVKPHRYNSYTILSWLRQEGANSCHSVCYEQRASCDPAHRFQLLHPVSSVQRMKQFLKFAALLVIGALVVLPALASLPCAFGASVACVPGCPMALNTMGPDCPMPSQWSATDCPQNCCTPALTQITPPLAAPEKFRFTSPAPSAVLPVAAFVSQPAIAVQTPIEPQFASPPRYILTQTFRI